MKDPHSSRLSRSTSPTLSSAAGHLPGTHRDPFDRMLVAQALSLDIAIVSNERLFDSWGVRRVWNHSD